jgi:hypothetical protein
MPMDEWNAFQASPRTPWITGEAQEAYSRQLREASEEDLSIALLRRKRLRQIPIWNRLGLDSSFGFSTGMMGLPTYREPQPQAVIMFDQHYADERRTLHLPWNDENEEVAAKVCFDWVLGQEPGWRPGIDTVVIHEKGSKIRIASLHPAAVSHACRVLNRRLLATLRRKGYTRDSFGSNTFTLYNRDSSALLYSTDLSKASDHIHHHFIEAFIESVAEAQQWSDRERNVMLRCHGSMRLPDGTLTTMGAHMGLGGTWAILATMNLFCLDWATNGDHKKGRVCGDDALGLLTLREKEKYNDMLTKGVGLKVNHIKSFYGKKGVFCENYAEKDGVHTATCYQVTKIAEATGAKTKYGFTDEGMGLIKSLQAVLEDTTVHPALRYSAQVELRDRQRRNKLVNNVPVAVGGSGLRAKRVSREALAILAYILNTGQVPRFTRTNCDLNPHAPVVNKELATPEGVLTHTQLNVALRVAEERVQRLQTGKVKKRVNYSLSAIRGQVVRMARKGQHLKLEPNPEFFNAKFRRFFSKFPLQTIRRPKAFRQVIRAALLGKKQPRYSIEYFSELIAPYPLLQRQDGTQYHPLSEIIPRYQRALFQRNMVRRT